MYYPIQLPFLLNEEFTRVMSYHEKVVPECKEFVLCFWSMWSKTQDQVRVKNVIIADGCIDLIVDFDQKLIFSQEINKQILIMKLRYRHAFLAHA